MAGRGAGIMGAREAGAGLLAISGPVAGAKEKAGCMGAPPILFPCPVGCYRARAAIMASHAAIRPKNRAVPPVIALRSRVFRRFAGQQAYIRARDYSGYYLRKPARIVARWIWS